MDALRQVSIKWTIPVMVGLIALMTAGGISAWCYRDLVLNSQQNTDQLLLGSLNFADQAISNSISQMESDIRRAAQQILRPDAQRSEDGRLNLVVEDASANEFVSLSAFELNAEVATPITQALNYPLLETLQIEPQKIETLRALPSLSKRPSELPFLFSQSAHPNSDLGHPEIAIFSLVIKTKIQTGSSQAIYLVGHFLQEPLRRRWFPNLHSQLYLFSKNGELVAHPSLRETIRLSHPSERHPLSQSAMAMIQSTQPQTMQWDSYAHRALSRKIIKPELVILGLIESGTATSKLAAWKKMATVITIFSAVLAYLIALFYARRLARSLGRLHRAAEQLSAGSLKHKLDFPGPFEVSALKDSLKSIDEKRELAIEKNVSKHVQVEHARTLSLLEQTVLLHSTEENANCAFALQYQPYGEFRGNFIHTESFGDIQWIFLGDSTGKNSECLLTTAIAKSFLKTYLSEPSRRQPDNISQLMETLNQVLFDIGSGKLSLALQAIAVNTQSGTLTMSSAASPGGISVNGIPASMELTKEQKNFNQNSCRGDYLGQSQDGTWESSARTLNSGETLLFFTKSLIDTARHKDVPLSLLNIERMMEQSSRRPATIIRKDLISKIETHLRGQTSSEELVFVVIQWQPQVLISYHNKQGESYSSSLADFGISKRAYTATAVTASTSTAGLKGSGYVNETPKLEVEWSDSQKILGSDQIREIDEMDESEQIPSNRLLNIPKKRVA